MAFIRVDMLPSRTLEQKRQLAEVLTREFARIASCEPASIGLIFTDVSPDNWGQNRQLLCDTHGYETTTE